LTIGFGEGAWALYTIHHIIHTFNPTTNETSHKSPGSHLQTTTIIITMKLLLSALVGISVIELGTGNNMLEGLAPSPSPSLSLSPTLSPAPSTGPVEGFTYIGTGWCLDSKDASYASIELVLNDANNNDCMKRCSQVQHPDFVGVSARDYGDGTRACFCGFSGGLPGEGDVNGAGYGVGPVQRSDGTSDISCYRYDVRSFLFGCMNTSFITYCILLTVASFVYMKLELHWLLPSYKESQGAVVNGGSNPNV
jgi:hypothetical protein